MQQQPNTQIPDNTSRNHLTQLTDTEKRDIMMQHTYRESPQFLNPVSPTNQQQYERKRLLQLQPVSIKRLTIQEKTKNKINLIYSTLVTSKVISHKLTVGAGTRHSSTTHSCTGRNGTTRFNGRTRKCMVRRNS